MVTAGAETRTPNSLTTFSTRDDISGPFSWDLGGLPTVYGATETFGIPYNPITGRPKIPGPTFESYGDFIEWEANEFNRITGIKNRGTPLDMSVRDPFRASWASGLNT